MITVITILSSPASVRVETGRLRRASCDGEEPAGVVAALRVHQHYDPSNAQLGYDIAVLKVVSILLPAVAQVSQDITMVREQVEPACLPQE